MKNICLLVFVCFFAVICLCTMSYIHQTVLQNSILKLRLFSCCFYFYSYVMVLCTQDKNNC